MKNYYAILEIDKSASEEAIKAVYKALVKKYHPDNYSGNIDVGDKNLAEINEAYEVLSNKNKKEIYDSNLKTKEWSKTKSQENEGKKYTDEETEDMQARNEDKTNLKDNIFTDFIKRVGKGVITSVNEANQSFNNAYLDGMNIDESTLIRRYKKANGYKRGGYAKALEERGFFYINAEGRYIPTYKFKIYY